jgi:hypothetical protein
MTTGQQGRHVSRAGDERGAVVPADGQQPAGNGAPSSPPSFTISALPFGKCSGFIGTEAVLCSVSSIVVSALMVPDGGSLTY